MTIITVEERPAQLVIDLGVDGQDIVHGSYREVLLNADGSVRSAEHKRTVTLKNLGDDFPWSDFIEPVVFRALRDGENAKQLQTALTQAEEALKALKQTAEEKLKVEEQKVAARDAAILSVLSGLDNFRTNFVNSLVSIGILKVKDPEDS